LEWNRVTKEINGEYTADARYITDGENSSIRLNTPLGDRQPEANPAFILAPLREGLEHFLGIAGWKAAAVILNIRLGCDQTLRTRSISLQCLDG
jgi:hypothetical protein